MFVSFWQLTVNLTPKVPSVRQTLCLSLGHVAFPPHTYWLSTFALSGAYWGIRLILKGKI